MLLHGEILLVQNSLVRFYSQGIYRAMTKEDAQRLVAEKCREEAAKVGTAKFLKDTFDFVFLEPRIYAEKSETPWNRCDSRGFCWRGRRDLNPRTVLPAYSLSRGAPSATWVLPRAETSKKMKL